MRNDIKLTGEKMLEALPKNLMDLIKQAFIDHELNYDQHINDCCLFINPEKNTCFLKYDHVDQFNWGPLIATFRTDGTGWYWTHYSRMFDNMALNDARRKQFYGKKRAAL